jgi:N-glycosylase/DNA lyase
MRKNKYLDLDQIAYSGQTFRWYPASKGYVVIHQDHGMHIFQEDNKIQMIPLTTVEKGYWEDYLDLGRNYEKIQNLLRGKNSYLDAAMDYGHGIRLLNQDAYEMMVTFMISSNNNMKRIKESIRILSERYGKPCLEFEGVTYYSFPKKEALYPLSIEDFRNCGLGYRDKYLYKFFAMLKSGFSMEDLHVKDDLTLKNALITVPGVGEKVANCVMLFGYHRRNGFPIDTWIKKILLEHFPVKDEDLQEYVADFFPIEGGLAQQYLFYYGGVSKK